MALRSRGIKLDDKFACLTPPTGGNRVKIFLV